MIIFLFFLLTLQEEFCVPKSNNCDFYTKCLEKIHHCDENGYALRFGNKYCIRFKNLNFTTEYMSNWRDKTMLCLQLSLLETLKQNISCSEIENLALKMHVPCYVQEPYSFCLNLSIRDLIKVISLIDIKDMFLIIPYFFDLIFQCLKQYIRNLLIIFNQK